MYCFITKWAIETKLAFALRSIQYMFILTASSHLRKAVLETWLPLFFYPPGLVPILRATRDLIRHVVSLCDQNNYNIRYFWIISKKYFSWTKEMWLIHVSASHSEHFKGEKNSSVERKCSNIKSYSASDEVYGEFERSRANKRAVNRVLDHQLKRLKAFDAWRRCASPPLDCKKNPINFISFVINAV